ncbi:hypothetical protein [Acidocella aminolytica]|nr:hypothetical protein [Acidocella aminolytica]
MKNPAGWLRAGEAGGLASQLPERARAANFNGGYVHKEGAKVDHSVKS